MIVKKIITEYLDLDDYNWEEDLKCWMNFGEIDSEDLTEDIFTDFIYDNYLDFFTFDEERIELINSNFEKVKEDYLNYFYND